MAKMRVHELAKEFGISSKEMLEILKDMNIPAKNHASTLVDAYVDKIRKRMIPEMEARKAAEEEQKRQKEEAAAKAAAEADEKKKAEEEAMKRAEEEARKKAEEEAKKQAEEEARKKAEEEARKKRELDKAARDKELAEREKEKAKREKENAAKESKYGKKKVLRADSGKRDLDDLLSRIEAESKRLNQEKEEKEQAKKAAENAKKAEAQKPKQPKQPKQQGESDSYRTRRPAETVEDDESSKSGKPRRNKKKGQTQHDDDQMRAHKKKPKRQNQRLDDFDEEDIENDRYKQMADKAEAMQRQKIIDEAREMVNAAQNEGEGRRKKRKAKREEQAKKRAEQKAIEKGIDPTLVLDDSVLQITTGSTVSEVADALGVNSSEIIKKLFLLGTPLTVTQTMSDDLIDLICDDFGRKVRIVSPEEEYEIAINDSEEDLEPRPPVVTVMGHVDHGKTSLLDAIRHTGVAQNEAGGITQAIGASVVHINGRQITFIDTPGHEAFTAMRARGAKLTDVVVLVVAADDGVMPQTIEAINHSKAAGVPIVVAVNKIDKPGANPDKVRQELTEYGIIPEEWGGENMFVNVSAKKHIGIDDLLETILLQADVLELKANPNALASGFVIEAKLDKGRGSVATVLVERGTLKVGDALVAGMSYGRVRALINSKGDHVDAAKPADPVEVLGLNSVPAAGDEFRVFEDDRDARNLAEDRALRARLKEQQSKVPVTLDDFFDRIEEGKVPDLNIVLKADTQGSIEAIKDQFNKMDQTEVHINVIHSAVGGVTETDVLLASASDAIIIGFGVRPQSSAKKLADKEKVDIRTYRIIYKMIEDINAARVGLLKPDIVEKETATIEVRETFKVPKVGTVAGCLVQDGEVNDDDKIRVVRDGTIVYEGEIASLRRFKDAAKSVKAGYECGIGIDGFQDIHEGDVLEAYKMVEVAREA